MKGQGLVLSWQRAFVYVQTARLSAGSRSVSWLLTREVPAGSPRTSPMILLPVNVASPARRTACGSTGSEQQRPSRREPPIPV